MQAATPDADSDARITRLEGIVEQLSQRMTSLETRMTSLETRMDAGFRDIHRRMDSGFRWIVGIQFTTLVALGTLILVKLQPTERPSHGRLSRLPVTLSSAARMGFFCGLLTQKSG